MGSPRVQPSVPRAQPRGPAALRVPLMWTVFVTAVAALWLLQTPLVVRAATTIQEIRVFEEEKIRAEHRTHRFRSMQFVVRFTYLDPD